jgi:hypothetical protein
MRIGGGASVAVVVAILAIFVGILGANGGGWSPWRNVAQARADAIEQERLDRAAAEVIARERLQAKANEARVKAEVAEATRDARILRGRLWAWGTGIGGALLLVGGAIAVVHGLDKKAREHRAEAGLMPWIELRPTLWQQLMGQRWLYLVDANRAPSSVVQVLADGQVTSPTLAAPQQTASAEEHGAMVQFAAAIASGTSDDELRERALTRAGAAFSDPGSRMPEITVLDAQEQDHITQLLEGGSYDDDGSDET